VSSAEVLEADLVVVGGGMAGMTAGARAAQAGLSVVVIEKAPQIGGSAAISGAFLWTATSLESMRHECPDGDPMLAEALVQGFPVLVEWIRSLGIEFSEERDVIHGRGFMFDILGYLQKGARLIENAGGSIVVDADVDGLIVEDTKVVGAHVRDASGSVEVRAPWVLLSSGGFQGNRGFMERFFGASANTLLHRSNPWSSGDGLRLGLSVGAGITEIMDSYYGHLVATPIPTFANNLDFVKYARAFSIHGVLVNLEGSRFVDEWRGDHFNSQAADDQPEGRVVLVFDEETRQGPARTAPAVGMEAYDQVADSIAVGAHLARADDLPGLAAAIAEWGYRAVDLDAAVAEHRTDALAAGQRPLGAGPYYAAEVRPAISFTEGGLRIDSVARVLDTTGAPIPGLLAAGADAGGTYNGGYAGGLANASVFGYRAAGTVIES
jgi:succinate dehydrogenase/fumarate reductase flavoprotein subunit